MLARTITMRRKKLAFIQKVAYPNASNFRFTSVHNNALPVLSQFLSLKIRRLAMFVLFRNVARRILKLQNCERVGRVYKC